MKLLNLREVAARMGIRHDTARKYARNWMGFTPDFPPEVTCPTCAEERATRTRRYRIECETCGGKGKGRDQDALDAWNRSRPGRGNGTYDRSAAAKVGWERRRIPMERRSA